VSGLFAFLREHAGLAPTGRAVLDVFPRTRAQAAVHSTKNVKGGNLGQPPSGAPFPVLVEAAGVPSAWLQPFNRPSRDRADGATLGRRRRTSRPVIREANETRGTARKGAETETDANADAGGGDEIP
jgi:hypothetical protein